MTANPSDHQLPTRPRAVFDQEKLPCCVSCALAGAMEILHPDWPPLAALFHYHVTRFDNQGADSAGFLYLDTAILTLTNQGICQHALHPEPFTPAGAVVRPSSAAYADGSTRQVGREVFRFRYRPLSGPSMAVSIREQLRDDCPVVLGITLPEGYPTSFLNPIKEWRDPANPPPSASYHCVLVVGYSDARQALRVQDSRGHHPSFEGGGWWMGYRVVDSSIVHEAYSLF